MYSDVRSYIEYGSLIFVIYPRILDSRHYIENTTLLHGRELAVIDTTNEILEEDIERILDDVVKALRPSRY